VIAAAVLAVVHVTGVLFAHPVWRPAELAATVCLLIYAIGYDLLPARSPASPSWHLSVAAAVLVAGAALTVPAAPSDAAEWQFLSPEEYSSLAWRAQFENLTPVTAVLIFVVVLLATRRGRTQDATLEKRTGIAAAVLIVGYVLLRAVIVARASPSALDLPVAAVAVVPLVLALAALALGVATAAVRRWRATAGAVLLAVAALLWINSALGAVGLPYEVRDQATFLSTGVLTSTDALPQPMQALTAALHLTAAVLVVTGLTRSDETA
jgi:membrane protein YdbS with pleckstrin-like domain